MPAPVVALPCGSRSTSSTRRFIAVRLAARLTAVVVFPTPPFWFTIARIRVTVARHHDQVAFRIEAGHRERGRRDDAHRRRQQRRSPRPETRPSSRSSCPPGARCRALDSTNVARSEKAREMTMSNGADGRVLLDARDHGLGVRQRQFVDRLLQERAFLVIAVERDDVPFGPRDGERNRRHAAAAADVEHAEAGPRRRSGRCGKTASASST